MTMNKKQLKLATTLLAPRASSGIWRHPSAVNEPLSLQHYISLAKKAEAGKLDFLFQPDQYRTPAATAYEFQRHVNVWPEPVTLLSALIAVTEHIGFAVTLSTTYNEPYHVARIIASLDHLSGGRAAWNIVHSRGEYEAANFNHRQHTEAGERADHALQFVDVVKALWDSWEDHAILAQKETGIYADASKVHTIDFESESLSVKGPLNISRPPQGHPVLIEAGQSDDFKERAARHANIVFTMLNQLGTAKQFYRDLKQRLAAYGRMPQDLLIMPGLHVYTGKTEAEAHQKKAELDALERLDTRVDRVSYLIGLDMAQHNLTLNSPLPDAEVVPENHPYRSYKTLADQQGWRTVKELYEYRERTTGHLTLIGTPAQIADELETWLNEEAADGFILIPSLMPADIDDFVELVIPELQRRGIFRTKYEGEHLRTQLSITRPLNTITGV